MQYFGLALTVTALLLHRHPNFEPSRHHLLLSCSISVSYGGYSCPLALLVCVRARIRRSLCEILYDLGYMMASKITDPAPQEVVDGERRKCGLTSTANSFGCVDAPLKYSNPAEKATQKQKISHAVKLGTHTHKHTHKRKCFPRDCYSMYRFICHPRWDTETATAVSAHLCREVVGLRIRARFRRDSGQAAAAVHAPSSVEHTNIVLISLRRIQSTPAPRPRAPEMKGDKPRYQQRAKN